MSDELHLDNLAKRHKLQLLQRRAKLRNTNGLAFYTPHNKQDQFHRAGKYRRRYVRTGNRFGKSDMGASEDCAFALGYRPWYPEGDPARYEGIPRHSTKGVIVVQNWDKADEIFTNQEEGTSKGKLFQKLPKESIVRVRRGKNGSIVKITIKSIWGGNSTIYLETVRSFKQDGMRSESSNWDWIHVDEPCPRKMWVALSRGLMDRGGKAWFTCTPVSEPWINDFFLPPRMARAEINEAFINDAFAHPRWMITGHTSDNPYLTMEDIEEFEQDISKEERDCRLAGIPMALSGLIYKDFQHDVHVYRECPHGWTDSQTPPKDYTIRTFIDPHPRTPHAVLHCATSPFGQLYIYRELFRPGLISDLVEHIQAQTEGYHVEDYLIDPIAFIENPSNGRCMADDFYDAGIPVVPAPKELTFGILKTQARLRERDEHDNPTVFVHENCDTFLFEVDRYIWQEEKEKPVDVDDHMMENFYRMILTGCAYVDVAAREAHYKPLSVTESSWKTDPTVPTTFNTRLPKPAAALTSNSGRYLN